MLLFVETGISLQLGYKLYLWKKSVENVAWCQKKRENWLKWATGYFQFFLEDASSIVTAYARIGSRCKVKAYYRASPS